MGDAGPQRPRGWWKSTTVYQIWPASYKDSDGDGIGDIRGIISTLPYLFSLGVETIWLSPMYASPQVDMGYDISDYESVYPPFGTLDDMQELIDNLHSRGMKIILDLVVNHTSDQHAWFKESASSRDNPKADWYMWKAPRYDDDGVRHPPNNWSGYFGGSTWKYVEARDQYYLHMFAVEQPDLNWENPETREAIYESAIRFWLRRGVDGFRIDTCNIYSKPPGLPDAPITKPGEEFQFPSIADGPRAHEFLKEMRMVFDEFGDIMSVGELSIADSREKLLKYVDASRRELREVFDFGHFSLDRSGGYDTYHGFTLPALKEKLERSQTLIDGTEAWTTTFMENHDVPRSISRFTTRDPAYHDRAGKLLATLLATTSGTLFLYQGQELGMTNVPRSWPASEYKDVASQNFLRAFAARHPHDPASLERALDGLNALARDNARTPVQWDGSAHAGFTTGTPWMRVNDNYRSINAAAQVGVRGSLLEHWRALIRLRYRHDDVFIRGSFELVAREDAKVFTFRKRAAGEGERAALVQLNFSDEERPAWEGEVGAVLASRNIEGLEGVRWEKLQPWEARVELVRG